MRKKCINKKICREFYCVSETPKRTNKKGNKKHNADTNNVLASCFPGKKCVMAPSKLSTCLSFLKYASNK